MIENTLYNPASLSEEKLIENFIVRTDVFEQIFSAIKEFGANNLNHHLIQGQRGMGKTTLLLRLKYEIERDDELSDKVIPVFFSEESYDVNSLSTLWEKLLKYLDDYFNTNGYYYNYTETFVDNENYEELCYNYLISKLEERGKKIVLFFDNFGELFFDILKSKQKERLYNLLLHDNHIQIIGTTAVVINDFKANGKDFIKVFGVSYLQGLNSKETFDLISNLQETCLGDNKIDLTKSKSKIDTLSILTGGVIRTIMMIYQVLLDDPDGKALNDLEKILDKVTPLYKHRIEDLPLQQRKIVDVIAKKWDATSVKDISNEIREDGRKVSSKIISAQLNQLEKNNIVEKKSTNTKNNLYQIKERFFNIWYLMRNGDRRDRRRIAWLTRFLEIWYDDEDSQDIFIKNHIKAIQSGRYLPSSALLVFEALTYSDKFNPMKLDDILKHTSKLVSDDVKKSLPTLLFTKKMKLAFSYFLDKKFEDAIKVLNSIKEENVSAVLLLTQIYIIKNQEKIAKDFLKTIKIIEEVDVLFFEKLCSHLNLFDLFFKVLKNSNIRESVKEHGLGEAYYDQGLILNAKEHYTRAYKLGNLNAINGVITTNVNLEHYQEAESFLLEGLKHKIIEISELLDFYSFIWEDNVKLKSFLEKSPKNGNYYLHSALILLRDENGDEVEIVNSSEEEVFINNLKMSVEHFSKDSKDGFIEERNFTLAFNLLLSHYKYNNKSLLEAYEMIQKYDGKFNDMFQPYQLLKCEIYLKNNIVDQNQLKNLLTGIDLNEDDLDQINDIFLILMAKREFNLMLEIFQFDNYKLRDVFKPTYYALMTFLNKEFPDEVLKMGDELKIPVEDILTQVEELKKEYNM